MEGSRRAKKKRKKGPVEYKRASKCTKCTCWVENLLGQIAQVRACVLKTQIWHIQAVWAVSKVHHKFIPHTFPLLLWQTLPKCSPNTVPERAVALKLFFSFREKNPPSLSMLL